MILFFFKFLQDLKGVYEAKIQVLTNQIEKLKEE